MQRAGVATLVAFVAAFFVRVPPDGWTLAAFAAFVATAVGFVARRWSDRVEIHADHLVAKERGRPARRVELDELATMTLRLHYPMRGFDANQHVEVTLCPREGRPLHARGSVDDLLPALRALGAAMASRMTRRMDEGETLYFEDRAPFPMGVLVGTIVLVAMMLLGLFALFDAPTSASSWLTALRVFGVIVLLGIGVRRVFARWSRSRRFGGLAVSAHGLRPLSEVERRAFAATGYRDAAGLAAGWVPWSDLVNDRLDGYGLSIDAASRDEPIVLTTHAHNLFPLHALMGEWIARARRARATGVRVVVSSTEASPPDPLSVDPRSARARPEKGSKGR